MIRYFCTEILEGFVGRAAFRSKVPHSDARGRLSSPLPFNVFPPPPVYAEISASPPPNKAQKIARRMTSVYFWERALRSPRYELPQEKKSAGGFSLTAANVFALAKRFSRTKRSGGGGQKGPPPPDVVGKYLNGVWGGGGGARGSLPRKRRSRCRHRDRRHTSYRRERSHPRGKHQRTRRRRRRHRRSCEPFFFTSIEILPIL